MTGKPTLPTGKPASKSVSAFLDAMAKAPAIRASGSAGRLVFALDATMSRQPTWALARKVQGEMFEAAAQARGGLQVQLVSFRGMGEFDVRAWTADAKALKAAMTGYGCRGGFTQIERTLAHAAAETARNKVHALVFVGDALEEDADAVCAAAGKLSLGGVPAFMFQEGANAKAEAIFREVARLTRGAYAAFDASAAGTLAELLRAVAVYASGGAKALADHARGAGQLVRQIANQMGGAR
ncbi:MAG: hypothetical protein QM698_00630 [Micropepsaceae bacterium]